MYIGRYGKPWLEVFAGYRAGRMVRVPGFLDTPTVLREFLATEGGYVTCHACPEEGTRFFRKFRTMAKYVKKHRHCGKPPTADPLMLTHRAGGAKKPFPRAHGSLKPGNQVNIPASAGSASTRRLLEPTIALGLILAIAGSYAWIAVIRGSDIDRQRTVASEAAQAACAASHRLPTKWWLLSGNVHTFDRCLRQHDAAYPGLLTLAEKDACRRLGSRAVEVGPCRELGFTN